MNITSKVIAIVALSVAISLAQQDNNVPVKKQAEAPAQTSKKASPAQAPAPAPTAKKVNPAQAPAQAPTAKKTSPAQAPAPAPTAKKVNPAQAPAQAPTAKKVNPAQAPAQAPTAKKASPAQAPAQPPTAKKASPAQAPAQPPTAKKASPAQAPAQVPTAKKASPTPKIEEVDELSIDNTPKGKPRGKITVEEYQKKQQLKQDSILSFTYHHGITLMGANTHDKRYGNFDEGYVWGAGTGMYYFYRYYLMSTMAFQGRIGAIYRYARFNTEDDAGSKTLSNGKKVDFVRNTEISYKNTAIDIPLEFKIGGHIEPTTFLYFGLTFGLTKSIYEQAVVKQKLDISSNDKNVEKDLEYLESIGLTNYPLTKRKTVTEPFYMDDWETNGWIGVGIDGKYLSAEFQLLVASGSTKDNHRYYHLFHDTTPTWRFMIDLSMR